MENGLEGTSKVGGKARVGRLLWQSRWEMLGQWTMKGVLGVERSVVWWFTGRRTEGGGGRQECVFDVRLGWLGAWATMLPFTVIRVTEWFCHLRLVGGMLRWSSQCRCPPGNWLWSSGVQERDLNSSCLKFYVTYPKPRIPPVASASPWAL